MTNDVMQKLEEDYAKIIKIRKNYECFDNFVKFRIETSDKTTEVTGA